MSGEFHWFTPVMLLALAAGIVALWRFSLRTDRALAALRRDITCPATGRAVSVTAVQERATGFYTGIERCSAFPNPEQVGCSCPCVKVLNALASDELAPFGPPAKT